MAVGRLGFLGCGYMGKAILNGLLRRSETSALASCRYGISVTNSNSVQKLQAELAAYKDRIQIASNSNLQTAKNSDVILLCFPPNQTQSLLGEPGMGKALEGKLIISLLAGVSQAQMKEELAKSSTADYDKASEDTQIVRVCPSLGAQTDESATIIAADEPGLPAESMKLTETIFESIGKSYVVPGHLLDSMMAMGTVCNGLMAIAVDAILDGSAVAGIPRDNALKFIGQSFRGYATLIEQGEEPADLKKSLMIPRGCTARTILNLEGGGVRSAISDAVVDIVAATEK